MISGDQLIMTRRGLHVSNKTLESIGIYPDSQVYMLPFQTYEYRESEPGYHFPMDLLITPIPPKRWPFVMRFLLRLSNRPGTLDAALSFFSGRGINILYSECTRSGHHHAALNLLGEITRLEARTVSTIFKDLQVWYDERKRFFEVIREQVYNFDEDVSMKIESPDWWGVLKEYEGILDGNSTGEAGGQSQDLPTKESIRRELGDLLDELGSVSKRDKPGDKLLQEKNALTARLLASYANGRRDGEVPIQELLEVIIDDAKPLIFRNEAAHQRGKIVSKEDLYHENEKVMHLPRLLLSMIISYKRVLCEKLKIVIVEDSLKNIKDKPVSEKQSESYLYNVKYYDHAHTYPIFSEPLIFNWSIDEEHGDIGKERIQALFRKVKLLEHDRKSTWSSETRLDLDPVLVTPVESLCHASYHRAYEEEFECRAGDSIIPFPSPPDYPEKFINGILSQNCPATIAVVSKNAYDLTLRLCPLPVSSLHRFLKIDLTRYTRDCMKHCKDNVAKNQPESILADERLQQAEQSALSTCGSKLDIECKGTTIGLLSSWTKVIRDHTLGDEISQPRLNVWRAYNRTFKLSETAESGSFHALVLATDDIFKGFPDEIHTQIEEKFKVTVKKDNPSGHVSIGKVTKGKISGGRVFVSLPFIHPMSKEWLHSVKKVGNEFGFTEVDTVESYTEPVTDLVANRIKNSHAMIQILALPVGKFDDLCKRDSPDYYRRMTWLFAEYLTAITNKLKVARLVDESTIDEREFLIGRDHASFHFSAIKPFSDFEDNVQKAFASLRKELADILGLG